MNEVRRLDGRGPWGAPFESELQGLADPAYRPGPVGLAGFVPEMLVGMLRDMLRIRAVEETIASLVVRGVARTPCHLAIGQEAIPVGVSSALRPTDRVFGGHRSHAHFLALGGSVEGLLAEVLCRATGVSGGRGGSMHIGAPEVGFLGSVPLVGATIPIAVGAGLAARLEHSDAVAVAYFGDGATEEGVFHESLNLARVLNVPVLFVCENNLFASHLDICVRQPSDRVARFAEANRVEARTVDGNDVVGLARTAQVLVDGMRREGGPAFLEAVTYRWKGHVGPNDDVDVGLRRRMSDLEAWKGRDPVARLAEHLTRVGVLPADGPAGIEAEERALVARAAQAAAAAPFPAPTTLLENVFSDFRL